MAVSTKQYFLFWAGAIALFLGFVWLFNDVLLPFVLGMVIAYLLNPLVKRFSTKGIKRTTTSAIIVILFFALLITIIAIISPILARESAALIEALPVYLERFFEEVRPYTVWLQENIDPQYMADAKVFLKDNITKVLTVSGGIAGGLAAGGQAVIGVITTLVLTPLVAFFMMKEWPAITKWAEDLIPRQHETMIKDLLDQIDAKLAGFIRGQLTVAFFLGLFYALALTFVDLNYGFLIGVMAGVLSIIPLVGSTIGLVASIGVAWFQSGELSYVGIVAAIFIGGQIVEGNFLSPKVLGDSVGLHPLWVLFALLAGASLFGFLGMLLAVPVAAVIGVLAGFALKQYKATPLYKRRLREGDAYVQPPPDYKVEEEPVEVVKKTAKKKPSKTRDV
jgi:predicted PurR-regulated permease PerM